MKTNEGILNILANVAAKDSNIVLRVPENEKAAIQNISKHYGLTVSDFIRWAIHYSAWATSEIELKVLKINHEPEYIDFANEAVNSIHLKDYMVSDSTYGSNDKLTNKHQHSFRFGSLIYQLATGRTEDAILPPGQIVRIYTGKMPPKMPGGIAIWTALNFEKGKKIWNNSLTENIHIYRIAKTQSESIFAGIPMSKLGNFQTSPKIKSL